MSIPLTGPVRQRTLPWFRYRSSSRVSRADGPPADHLRAACQSSDGEVRFTLARRRRTADSGCMKSNEFRSTLAAATTGAPASRLAAAQAFVGAILPNPYGAGTWTVQSVSLQRSFAD